MHFSLPDLSACLVVSYRVSPAFPAPPAPPACSPCLLPLPASPRLPAEIAQLQVASSASGGGGIGGSGGPIAAPPPPASLVRPVLNGALIDPADPTIIYVAQPKFDEDAWENVAGI